MDKQLETTQLLARFKLQVKRKLGQSVDLELLTRDPAYARQRLSELEELAEDEELLIMVLRMRDLLKPTPPVASENPAKTPETRSYLHGARAW